MTGVYLTRSLRTCNGVARYFELLEFCRVIQHARRLAQLIGDNLMVHVVIVNKEHPFIDAIRAFAGSNVDSPVQ